MMRRHFEIVDREMPGLGLPAQIGLKPLHAEPRAGLVIGLADAGKFRARPR